MTVLPRPFNPTNGAGREMRWHFVDVLSATSFIQPEACQRNAARKSHLQRGRSLQHASKSAMGLQTVVAEDVESGRPTVNAVAFTAKNTRIR
ncbi:MAG TPA: hypothetical protein VJW76_11715 [Verrucomicrobiae bacterium]|nr:hypothetical protein [Verrucomicrobiae bacterium]